MRVLHVITGLAAGGAERQLPLLIRHAPFEAEVASLTRGGVVAAQLRSEGALVHELPMRGNRDVTVVPRLARLIRAGRFDVVHTHLYRACVHGRVAARLAGVRGVVATEHSLGETHIERRPKTAAVRGLYLASERLGQMTVAVTPTVARRLVAWGVPAQRVTVVPLGIDPAEFRYDGALRAATRARLGIPPEAFVIGGVGRMEPRKGFEVLVRALGRLPEAWLLLVGDGPDRGRLQSLAGDRGVGERVRCPGELGHVRGVLSAMDVLAAPSMEETFGLAVLEGLAAGLPVRYVTCPALDDLPAGSAPRARRVEPGVARFVEELRGCAATAPAERTAGRREVVAVVTHYDVARLAGRLQALYTRVCRSPGRGLVRPGSPLGDCPRKGLADDRADDRADD